MWEPGTVELLRETRADGDLIHAGTYFGDFIPALARSRHSGAILWAFEPNLVNHCCAQATALINELGNVALFHAALDESAGASWLVTSNTVGVPLGGASHIVEQAALAPRQAIEEIDLLAIDEVVADTRPVVAIHLDVEGRERQALSGAMRTIERCRPLLVVERLPDPEWVEANLSPLGYAITGTVDGNSVLTVS